VLELKLLPGESWWGGVVDDGIAMPFGNTNYERNLALDLAANQGNPLLISNKGRYIWSEEPYIIKFNDGLLCIKDNTGEIYMGEGLHNLKAVFQDISAKYFPPAGKYPDLSFFSAPQYNTWIEMMYEPSQAKVLEYAKGILANGFPPGIMMIDVGWFEDYGNWTFHTGRFPEPAQMIKQLHQMGFKVMLWVCPFISPDSATYRDLAKKGYLIRGANGEPVIRQWWDGYSAVLDGTNPAAVGWLRTRLDELMKLYEVDGFKFDAGDPSFYQVGDVTYQPATTPHQQCEAWARIGLNYPFNEYRACWKLAGQPLVQRLRDKHHSWHTNGLNTLIPNALAQGLLGYAFVCPDMIGGGEFNNFLEDDFRLDAELFVRYAQCSALFPMMQFSTAPWRVLDKQHLEYCREAAELHVRFSDVIVELAREAAMSGEPIMRHLEYVFPGQGYEHISDQFMLGNDILVAPVITKGATSRQIIFPTGKWRGDDGSLVEGPTVCRVEASLARLPWYHRVK
jgi:alpha-glucosidase (family GH31 glycosyl hydrolase)